ncbi:MAG TPA: hypothetical protein VH394_18720 [Thermoanaerobaculia bacterium]|jgi:hypothetical protein|nr:hypothetical protein [Thermoanaerobaculia bacterium]
MKPQCYVLAALFLAAAPVLAAIPNPDPEDIDYIAEHLPESGQDARFLSLPWPSERLRQGGWQTTIEGGYVDTAASFMTLDGPMIAASAAYSFRDGWALAGLGFYDSLTISGDRGREILNPTFARPPLDLPEFANFSNPRGDYLYTGAGLGLFRDFPGPEPERRWWTFAAGVIWTRLELDGFQMDYEVATGQSAGAQGVLDHSSTNDYATPFVGLRQTRLIGERYSIAPRILAASPLPKGDFTGRITGPGFDLGGKGATSGRSTKIGDPFVALGMEILHRPSGLGVDLGGTVYFAGAEGIVHKGVSRALTLQISWHR